MAVWSRSKFKQLSKGFLGRRKNCFVVQVRAVFKSLQYQYIWRKLRRRNVKTQYIKSINASSTNLGVSYSHLIYGLNRSNIELDRKILANLAEHEPYSFKAILDEIQAQVKLPEKKVRTEVSYEESLKLGFLYHGEYIKKESRDIQAKPIQTGESDYFGTNSDIYPYNIKELEQKYDSNMIPLRKQKKIKDDGSEPTSASEEEETPAFW